MEWKFSEWQPVRGEVTQGRSSGPLLYNALAADVPRKPGIETPQYADDIAAFTPIKTLITQSTTCRDIYLILNHGYTCTIGK
jgi:hypothetical protein